ncbi:MAG TPA: class I SAM-dependent methyltransferase [Sedimenticola sp.]|nr:class I SAM-dependent methyltransferase [Sedimenticola sp.]
MNGTGVYGKMRHFASRLRRRLAPVAPVPAAPAAGGETVDFVCNLCGHHNRSVPLEHAQNREFPSCGRCHSSLRMRSVIYVLSMELYGRPLTLPDFPEDKALRGLGMSDWEGYARGLEKKFSYTNTYYHAEPRLDITDIDEALTGTQRFLISSDVFEHIPVAALEQAFRNSRRLLRDDGVFIFTVPFTKEGKTREHFPRMHDFRIIETNGKRFLYNRTKEGEEEIFDDLVFHGGDGMTLEMRMFSEPDLRRQLQQAGFASVRVYADHYPPFGILWPMDWAVPIAARCSAEEGA